MRLREAHPQPAQRTIRYKKMRVGVTLPSMKGKYVTKGFDIELGAEVTLLYLMGQSHACYYYNSPHYIKLNILPFYIRIFSNISFFTRKIIFFTPFTNSIITYIIIFTYLSKRHSSNFCL